MWLGEFGVGRREVRTTDQAARTSGGLTYLACFKAL